LLSFHLYVHVSSHKKLPIFMSTRGVEIGDDDVNIPFTFASYEVVKGISSSDLSVAVRIIDRSCIRFCESPTVFASNH
jgi:hypothetical protein